MGGSLVSMVQTKVDRRRCGKVETALVERVRPKNIIDICMGRLREKMFKIIF